jgi:exopolysaccharide production protein ExoY
MNRIDGHFRVSDAPFVSVKSIPGSELLEGAALPGPAVLPGWKRALDLLLILTALPLLVPLALFIAFLIRMLSPGPALFRQERVGYRGGRFPCFKFRTMAVNADATTHRGHLEHLMSANVPMEKMDAQSDPRVIPFGRLLRSSGLDELPQLINVLLGEMSLVGPRPCLPYEYDRYLSWQKERFHSVPGLTGWWQVSGKNRTTFVEMVRLDIHYTCHKNIWLDLKIILLTVPVLMTQMWDARKTQKSALRPTATGTIIPTLTVRSPSPSEMPFTSIIQPDCESCPNQSP